MEIRQLREQDTPDLLNVIDDAFADYMEPFQLNTEQLQFKMMSENIILEWSVGAFVGEHFNGNHSHNILFLSNAAF